MTTIYTTTTIHTANQQQLHKRQPKTGKITHRFAIDTKNNSVLALTSAGGRVTTGIRSSTISRLLHSRKSTIAMGLSRTITAGSVVWKAACTVDSAVFSPQPTSEFDFCTRTGTKYWEEGFWRPRKRGVNVTGLVSLKDYNNRLWNLY
jgi:hypothetical protein